MAPPHHCRAASADLAAQVGVSDELVKRIDQAVGMVKDASGAICGPLLPHCGSLQNDRARASCSLKSGHRLLTWPDRNIGSGEDVRKTLVRNMRLPYHLVCNACGMQLPLHPVYVWCFEARAVDQQERGRMHRQHGQTWRCTGMRCLS